MQLLYLAVGETLFPFFPWKEIFVVAFQLLLCSIAGKKELLPKYFTCKCGRCNCRASFACTIWSHYNYGHNFVTHLICWVLERSHRMVTLWTLEPLFSWKFGFRISSKKIRDVNFLAHNSPIYDECQTQSGWVLALPWERAHQNDSNDTPQPMFKFQVGFPLLWIKAYPGLS